MIGGFFFIYIFDEQIKLKNMCITNRDCQEGFRCENESGQCVPSNASGDPIKPRLEEEPTSQNIDDQEA